MGPLAGEMLFIWQPFHYKKFAFLMKILEIFVLTFYYNKLRPLILACFHGFNMIFKK